MGFLWRLLGRKRIAPPAIPPPPVHIGGCETCGKSWSEMLVRAVFGGQVAFPPEAEVARRANWARYIGRRQVRSAMARGQVWRCTAAEQDDDAEFFGPPLPGHVLPDPDDEEGSDG